MPNDCPKCKAVLEYIRQQREHPPVMDFQTEKPFYDTLNGIEEIIERKSPLEQAYEEAKHGRPLKNLLKARRNQL